MERLTSLQNARVSLASSTSARRPLLGAFILALACAAYSQGDPSKLQGIVRLEAAVRLMQGLDNGFTNFYLEGNMARRGYDVPLPELADSYGIQTGICGSTLDAKTHRMRTFSCSTNPGVKKRREADPSPRISLEEAQRICTELYHISDDRYPLKFTEVKEYDEEFQMWAQPDVGPLMLWQQGECVFTVSRHRGVVTQAYMGYAPDLRFADAPVVDEAVAHAAAIDAYFRYKPFAWTEVKRTGLGLAAPRFFKPREFTDELMELGLANIAIPVYITYFCDPSTYQPYYKRYTSSQFVYVDGRTGRAIAITDHSGGAFSVLETPDRNAAPLDQWDSVEVVGSRAGVVGALFKLAKEPRRFEFVGESVLLRHGEEWVEASYDRFQQVLRVGDGPRLRWYKVGGPAIEALKQDRTLPGPVFGAATG